MSYYQKLINELKKMEEQEKVQIREKTETQQKVEKEEKAFKGDVYAAESKEERDKWLQQNLFGKIDEFQNNIPLMEVIFMSAMKKNNLDPEKINVDLAEEEREKILALVLELIRQFEEMETEAETITENNS